jgi:hypothetical protein
VYLNQQLTDNVSIAWETSAQRCRVYLWRIIVVRDVAVVTSTKSMMQGVCELESVRVEECGGYGSLYCTNGSREERQRGRDRERERENAWQP